MINLLVDINQDQLSMQIDIVVVYYRKRVDAFI